MTKLTDILEEAGVTPGEWGETQEHVAGIEAVSRQRENLLKLKGVLEKALVEDQKRLADLREQLIRLKHGGGS